MKFGTAAEDDAVEAAAAAVRGGQQQAVAGAGGGTGNGFNSGYGGLKMELHAVAFGEPCGESTSGFAGIDAEFTGAVQSAAEFHRISGGGEVMNLGGAEQLTGDLQVFGSVGELLEQGPFVVVVGEVNRAALADADTGSGAGFNPALSAEQSGLEEVSVGLADRPDHAEVAN